MLKIVCTSCAQCTIPAPSSGRCARRPGMRCWQSNAARPTHSSRRVPSLCGRQCAWGPEGTPQSTALHSRRTCSSNAFLSEPHFYFANMPCWYFTLPFLRPQRLVNSPFPHGKHITVCYADNIDLLLQVANNEKVRTSSSRRGRSG